MASKFLDLIKRFSNSTSQSSSGVPLSPRRPRRVNPEVKPDVTAGHSGDTRPRYALGEPDQATKLRDQSQWLASDPNHGPGGSVIPKTSKLKAALLAMLQNAGASANRAVAQGNVGWGGVAQALGGAGGGAVAGAIDSDWVTRAKHEQAVAKNQQAQAQQMDQLSNQAQLEDLKARAEDRHAQADERRRQPEIEAAKLGRQDAEKRDRDFALAVSQILQQREKSSPEAIQSLIEETEQRFNRRVPVVPFKGSDDSSGSGAIRTITNSDGSQSVIRFKDGSWEVEYRGERSATDIDRERRAENESGAASAQRAAKINESSALYRKADNNEHNAAQLEQNLESIALDTYEGQEERARRKQEIDRLRTEARALRVQGDKARSEGESVYVPRGRSGSPDSHEFSKASWKASNPGGNLNEAIRAARARGYRIID
jgi:hypothetical protein